MSETQRTTFARRPDRKQQHTEEEVLEIVRRLHKQAGGPLLRLRKAATFRFKYSYWAMLLPDGPNVALSTMRMLERLGYARHVHSDRFEPGFQTYLLTGKGLE